MITLFVLLTILAVGGVLFAGIGIAFTLVTIVLKLMWLGVQFIFHLGWAALIVAAVAMFLILKLTGLLVIVAFVFLVLALVWATGTLLGAHRRPAPRYESRAYRVPAGSSHGVASLQSRLEAFDRRLHNIETIASQQ